MAGTTLGVPCKVFSFCSTVVVASIQELCGSLVIFRHHQLAPFVGKTVICKPYKRFLDKELHGTYSLDGNHQQRLGRRATTYCLGETGSNPYSGSGMPH